MKRVVVKVFVFLLLGAVVNVVVAMSCAVLAYVPADSDSLAVSWREDELTWWSSRCPFPDVSLPHKRIETAAPSSIDDDLNDAMICVTPRQEFSNTLTVRSVGFEVWTLSSEYGFVDCRRTRSGLPLAALEATLWEDDRNDANIQILSTGFPIELPIRTERQEMLDFFFEPRVIPYGPIWPGFAINTFFYAAILWLLFAAPGSVRRWRRGRRGCCAKCAYPVGASDVCTECGAMIRRSFDAIVS